MRTAATAAAAAAMLLASTPARAANGMVQWDIEKRQLLPKLARRAGGTVTEVITNEKLRGGYFSTCTIGTPPQAFTLQLDTGSSDIWVPSSGSRICSQATRNGPLAGGGCSLGSFDYEASRTFLDIAPGGFNISYVDNSFAIGDYFTDSFEIGGSTVQNMTMGLALSTDIPYGLVGVGYETNEASIGTINSKYPNLPVVMQKDGLVNTVAFSLWLNDLGASTGSILFGGIDTGKYIGNLTRVNILKDPDVDAYTHFTVALSSLTAASRTGSDGLTSAQFPMPAVLDSGTTYTYLPNDLAQQVWNEVGAVYLGAASANMAVLPCGRANARGNFTFGFGGPGGPRISVGMDELVIDPSAGNPPTFDTPARYAGQPMCVFGIQNFSAPPYLLGDSFLRSAYVVYDLINNQIALAATDFNSTRTELVPFPSQGAQIPSATPAPNQGAVPSGTAPPGFTASDGFQSAAGRPGPGPMGWSAVVAACGVSLLVALGSGVFLLV